MSQLDILWQVQSCDKEIYKFKGELKELKKGEEIESLYLKLRQREYDSTNINTQIEVNNTIIHRNNKKLDDLNYRLKEIEEKLYSGEVADLGQLEYMNVESKKIKKEVERIESETLSLMEKVDILKKDVVEVESELKKISEDLRFAEDNHKNRIEKIENEIQKSIEKRDNILKQLDDKLIKSYNDLQETKGKGKAVVKVDNNRCNGCHMNIPLSLLSKLKKNETIAKCDNCGRILYYTNE